MLVERAVRIPVPGGIAIDGNLSVGDRACGLVVFAHGSGSGRHSPRNRAVAAHLQRHDMGTLLVDLLTPEEEAVDLRSRHLRFDVELLGQRLVAATAWARAEGGTSGLPIGYFGASTGAAAALIAADPLAVPSAHPIAAVVCRGGRPDLAGDRLERVTAPTLLIVGSADQAVFLLNQRALLRLHAPARLEVVPNATHLFDEPGALDAVAALAAPWFLACFQTVPARNHL